MNNEARALVNAALSEYHGYAIDAWVAKDGPGRFAEILERRVAAALDQRLKPVSLGDTT